MNKMPKVIYLEWLDHFSSYSGWTPIKIVEDHNQIPTCYTVGFLLKETDEAIMLALNYSCDNNPEIEHIECSNVMTVLKSCITKKRVLKYKNA